MDPAQRFDRQIRFAPLGRKGQERIQSSRVCLVGCGALGGVLAQTLVRAGVGELVLVDRDIVEPSNLPRQVLFDEQHATEGTPKALAASASLARIGGPTRLVPHVAHVDAKNLPELARGASLLLDGTDNLETRYLLNDFAVEQRIPWIYAGVVGGSGLVLPVLPGEGACLACLFPEPPPPGVLPTCDSAGVILPAVGLVASFAAGFALRILALGLEASQIEPVLVELDAWNASVRRLPAPRAPNCRVCVRREFASLQRPAARDAVVLCGRNAVQIPAGERALELELVARNLPPSARDVQRSHSLLRFTLETAGESARLTVFRDGRILVEGTDDARRARALVDRALGN